MVAWDVFSMKDDSYYWYIHLGKFCTMIHWIVSWLTKLMLTYWGKLLSDSKDPDWQTFNLVIHKGHDKNENKITSDATRDHCYIILLHVAIQANIVSRVAIQTLCDRNDMLKILFQRPLTSPQFINIPENTAPVVIWLTVKFMCIKINPPTLCLPGIHDQLTAVITRFGIRTLSKYMFT